jgi:hypothetical protein
MVRNAAFADHWGSTVIEASGGRSSRQPRRPARPSVVALDKGTGGVIGLCVNQACPEAEAVTGLRDAWSANICTLRPARRLGVASAMIARSLSAFAPGSPTRCSTSTPTPPLTPPASTRTSVSNPTTARSPTRSSPPRRGNRTKRPRRRRRASDTTSCAPADCYTRVAL